MHARRGTAADFDWRPSNVPDEFLMETVVSPALFKDVVTRLNLRDCTSDWQRALRIAEHLAIPARDLGPIRNDLETTYTRILAGYGYCADFVKVFIGLAHTAGLFARQWAFSFSGFGGFGHTVVEIYDRASDKWLFLDVYNNFHVCDAATAAPISALEFREHLLRESADFRIVPNGAGRLGYPIEKKLIAYFRRGLQEWYLVGGNAIFSFEAHSLVRWSIRISGPAAQLVAACFGRLPSIQVLVTPENAVAVTSLMALARRFRVAMFVLVALMMMLVWQAGLHGSAARLR